MPRYAAFFRGINVGKAKRIAMADLRALLGKLGYRDVATLLNSGNAVFTAPSARPATCSKRIHDAVATSFGVDAQVIVKSAKEISDILDGNALLKFADDPARLLIALVQDAGTLAAVKPLAAKSWGKERLHVGDHAAYLWCGLGILESVAIKELVRGLAGSCTTRNLATLQKVHALLAAET